MQGRCREAENAITLEKMQEKMQEMMQEKCRKGMWTYGEILESG